MASGNEWSWRVDRLVNYIVYMMILSFSSSWPNRAKERLRTEWGLQQISLVHKRVAIAALCLYY